MKIKKISSSIKAARFENGGIFAIGEKQKILDNKLWENIVRSSDIWRSEATRADVVEKFITRYPDIDVTEISHALDFLEENNFTVSNVRLNPQDRFSRSALYYESLGADSSDVQNKLSNASVAIVGCGGIGNHVAVTLATSGIGHLILIDDDYIELSNLTRQVMFTERHVGLNKVDVLKEALLERNSSIKVETHRRKITQPKDLEEYGKIDLVILSGDSPEAHDSVNSYCVGSRTALMHAGYMNDIAVAGPFYIPGKSACLDCAHYGASDIDENDPLRAELERINASFKTISFPPVNAMAAAMASNDVIRYFSGANNIATVGKRIGVYSSDLSIRTQIFDRNVRCKTCSV